MVDSQILLGHDVVIDEALLKMGFSKEMIDLMWLNEKPTNIFDAVELLVAHQEAIDSSEEEDNHLNGSDIRRTFKIVPDPQNVQPDPDL